MEYNVLNGIIYFAQQPVQKLVDKKGVIINRANAVGESLENFVMKMLSQDFALKETETVLEHRAEVFSYFGNANNPPDFLLRGGDAIEVKKVQTPKAKLALNSSFPKDKLYSTDTRILKKCIEAEDWSEKDMFYIVGYVPKNTKSLNHLWLVHGACYSAEKSCYENIAETISDALTTLPEVDVDTETNELSGVKKVDPLGITNLRVRGMWGINHPTKVFDYIYRPPANVKFSLSCIMLDKKFQELGGKEDMNLPKDLVFKAVKIKNPNNPAQLLRAWLITFNIT